MASLADIQRTELSILQEIDAICRDKNIPYLLAYGTFLGAVRHHGYIPWDDDTDIYMTFRDYKRFSKAFKSKDYFLQNKESDPRVPYIMPKVRKNNTVMREKGMEKLDIHHGIWVDIFIYLDAPKSIIMKRVQYFLSEVIRTIRCKELAKLNDKQNSIQRVLNYLPNQMSKGLDYLAWHLIEILGNPKSGESIILTNIDYDRSFIKTDLLKESAMYSFEGGIFPGPRNYDKYLKKFYGEDYMTPVRYDSHISSYDDVEV